MPFDQRSYSGKVFRPKPEVFLSEDEHILIVCTPWGRRNSCREAMEIAKEYILAAKKDAEATSPIPKLPGLSHFGNIARTAALLMHEHIQKADNKTEYTTGTEVFLALRDQWELIWTQMGQPNALLCRPSLPILPLSTQFDLSMEFSKDPNNLLPPLPNHMIGVDNAPNISVNSIQYQEGDKILLLSRAWVPRGFLSTTSHTWSLMDLSKLLSKESAEVPYWLGAWEPS